MVGMYTLMAWFWLGPFGMFDAQHRDGLVVVLSILTGAAGITAAWLVAAENSVTLCWGKAAKEGRVGTDVPGEAQALLGKGASPAQV